MNQLEKHHRIFAKYKRLKSMAEFLIHDRQKGNFGIAVDDDLIAISYQQHYAWRLEVMDAFLSGREPNHAVKRWWRKTDIHPHVYYSEYLKVKSTKDKQYICNYCGSDNYDGIQCDDCGRNYQEQEDALIVDDTKDRYIKQKEYK
jgi:methionyl-tRNA synthetase